MVREELHVSPRLASDATLTAAWLALDEDGSGHISTGVRS